MILHQIELQGFLSHRGTPQADGSFGFTTIDFSRSPLWLIHGENGSGKSALFDAICFALYKCARGPGGGKLNLGYLVHHGADRAQVRVTIEIGGTVYRVDRAVNHISKTPNTMSQIWRAKTNWETLRQMPDAQREKNYDAVSGTKNRAEDWIEAELRMSFETFTYTALLRQGETDAFLVADAGERKKCLLRMLDLSSFVELGTAAAKENSAAKKVASDAATRRDSAPQVTRAQVEEAAQISGLAKEKLKLATSTWLDAERALENGEKAAKWQTEIADLEAQNTRDRPILARKAAIVNGANRARELGQILPRLSALWDAKARLSGEKRNCNSVQSALEKAREDGEVLAKQLAPTKQNALDAQQAQREANAASEIARQAAQKAKDEAATLAEIERLEAQIARANQQLAPLQNVLGREGEIVARAKRLRELNARVPLLEVWAHAQSSEQRSAKALHDAQNVREELALELEVQQKNEITQGESWQKANEILQQEQDKFRGLKAEFEQLKKYSHNSREDEDAGRCHFCGSELDTEHLQKQLQRGRELKKQLREAEANLENLKATAREANQFHTATDRTVQALQAELRQTDYAIRTEQTSLSEKQENTRRTATKCAKFADQIEFLGALQDESNELEAHDVNGEIDELNAAKNQAVAGRTTIDNARIELEKLPAWSYEQRAQLRGAQAQSSASLTAANQAMLDAQDAMRQAQKTVDELERQIETNDLRAENLEKQSDDLRARCEQIAVEIERLRGELPAVWQRHPCCEASDALEQLKAENQNLSGAFNEEIALQNAQERAQGSMSKIEALRARLDELPAQHRRDVAALRVELDQAEAAHSDCESIWKNADKIERDLDADARELAAREAELREAETEAALCKTLAEALGPKGLQRAIQEKAQQKLKAEADKTLLKLSGGDWSISLQDASEERLEIMATDHRSGHDKKFEYLSGGEKFRISVALAVAIGQSATGNAPLGTLIIDEGFGALDAANRKRMVVELQRLSADVFGGGRVIVVSHQDDVCDDFPQRYAIARDENGLVSATRFPTA